MKKHLSLILAVLMLLTSVGVNAFAADCQHQTDVNNPDYYNVVNATCTEQGYTEYLCVLCGEVVSKGAYIAPLDHSWGDYVYEYNEENDCYYKYQPCTREYVVKGQEDTVKCDARSYELDADGAKEIYYSVKFVNDWVTATYNPDVKYTDLAYTYKQEDLHTEKIYVKKGDEAVYDLKRKPSREKDTAFGRYNYAGWSTTPGDTEPMLHLIVEKNNTVFYPVFEGAEVKYNVTYYGVNNEQLTVTQKVVHGGSLPYRVNGDGDYYADPVKAADLVNTYEFEGWIVSGNKTEPVTTVEMDTYPIYDNIILQPSFKAEKIKYTIELYEETFNGKGEAQYNLYEYNGKTAIFEGVTLESNLLDDSHPDEIGLINNKNFITRESDKTYFYTWKGTWQVLKADGSYGTKVNLNNFKGFSKNDIIVTEGSNGEEIRTIRLVPVFERSLVRYAVDIKMEVPSSEDDSYYLGEAEVQVIANDGQVAAIGKTNADGMFRCYLNYNVPFTVNVLSYDNKYIGNQVIFDLQKAQTGGEEAEAKLNLHKVIMELNPEYETHCSCIHHNSLLQPIIVRIFNILYTFFNVKYVCCYDMYSTIGPLLEYVPD